MFCIVNLRELVQMLDQFGFMNVASRFFTVEDHFGILQCKPTHRYTRYADVLARISAEGFITPYAVCRVDGRTYYIGETVKTGDPYPDIYGNWQRACTVRLADHETTINIEQPFMDKDSDGALYARWWVYVIERRDKPSTSNKACMTCCFLAASDDKLSEPSFYPGITILQKYRCEGHLSNQLCFLAQYGCLATYRVDAFHCFDNISHPRSQ